MSRLIKLADGGAKCHASVLFFHGLGGDAYATWQQSDKPESLWPIWLTKDIPGLSIYSIGYETPVSRWRGSAMHLTDRATNILERLLIEPSLQRGSLIFVGHSLGGLLIKQIMRIAESEARRRSEAATLVQRVKKVAFLATPHMGSDLATWGDRLRILTFPTAATASLVRNDPNLRDLNVWYRDWANSLGIAHLILVETKATTIFGVVVKPDSSDPGIGSRPVPIDANHIDICKPGDESHETYAHVRAFIQRDFRQMSTKLLRAGGLTPNITINIFGTSDSIEALGSLLRQLMPQQVEPDGGAPDEHDEIDVLIIPRHQWHSGLSPAALLRADIVGGHTNDSAFKDGVVPFHGRNEELKALGQWCDAGEQLRVRVCTGRGGMGKTRLAIRLCELRSRSGWRAGFLPDNLTISSADAARQLLAGDKPTLIVVDYAATRLKSLGWIMREAPNACTTKPVRLMLLEREKSAWYHNLAATDGTVSILLRGPASSVRALPALAIGEQDRAHAFGIAGKAFARLLGTKFPDRIPENLNLADDAFEAILVLHMAALLQVEGVEASDGAAVLDCILDRERSHWLRMLDRANLPQLLAPAVSKAVAAIWRIGGLPSLEMTRRFLRCIPLLVGEQEAVVHAIATGLREIYGGRLWVDPLQPDILAHRLVSTENEVEPGSVSKIVRTYREGSG